MLGRVLTAALLSTAIILQIYTINLALDVVEAIGTENREAMANKDKWRQRAIECEARKRR